MILRALRVSAVLLRVGFASAVAYRAEMIIWFLTTTMPLVMLALWSAAASEGAIGGYGQPEFVTYFALSLIVRHLSSSWIVWILNAEIRAGTLSMQLLRPVHPIWFYVCENLAAMPMRAIVLVPIVGLLLFLLPHAPVTFDAVHLGAFVASLIAAWVLHFAAQTLIGLLSLWTQQSMGIWDAWFAIFSIFSGYLVPVSLFPGWLRGVTDALPFHSMAGFPTEILMGNLSPGELVRGLVVSYLWVAVFLALAGLAWQRGLRRFGAFGG